VIDLHCHILPGIDDGPPTVADSLQMARIAVDLGMRTVVATPHVADRYPNRSEDIARHVHELNKRLVAASIPLEVLSGAEIALARLIDTPPEELARLSIAGGSWILLEPPFVLAVGGIERAVDNLFALGFRVLLAHPERCPAFHRDRATLERLVGAGVATSVTAGSLVGRFGTAVRRFSHTLVGDGLVHNVASDAHDYAERPPGIADELRECGLDWLADWLANDVPAAIIAGAELPQRPVSETGTERPRRTRRWFPARGAPR
jgi:protein-tyrosine phosphatase